MNTLYFNDVFNHLVAGITIEEVLNDFPQLPKEDILAYCCVKHSLTHYCFTHD